MLRACPSWLQGRAPRGARQARLRQGQAHIGSDCQAGSVQPGHEISSLCQCHGQPHCARHGRRCAGLESLHSRHEHCLHARSGDARDGWTSVQERCQDGLCTCLALIKCVCWRNASSRRCSTSVTHEACARSAPALDHAAFSVCEACVRQPVGSA